MEETQTTTSGESTEVTSQEPVSTTETTEVTSEETTTTGEDTTQDTDSDSTVTETTEEEPKTTDWEKNYKELQSEFTKKTQELSALKKKQEQQSAIVSETGQVKQAVIDKVALQIANEELYAYRNAVFELDSEVQQDVVNLLNAYQNSGNRQYLDRAKEYYGSNFVGNIEAQKVQRTNQLANELEAKRQEYTSKLKQDFEDGLKANAPTALSYYDKDSEYYSPELANAIATSPDMNVGAIEEAIKNIEAKVIAKYKANLAKLEAAQKGTKSLNLPKDTTSKNVSSTSLADVTDQKELDALVDKYIK